jgi:hypothetical protein
LSDRYRAITEAGGRIVCISVDSPLRNAALIAKLKVPFPILSDPDRSVAIEPYGVADPKDERNIARPAIFVVAPDGEIVYSSVSRDFADRTSEEAAVVSLIELGLSPTTAERFEIGPAEPGPYAMKVENMEPYYRGAMFAVRALRGRHPGIADDANDYIAQMKRYVELSKALREDG